MSKIISCSSNFHLISFFLDGLPKESPNYKIIKHKLTSFLLFWGWGAEISGNFFSSIRKNTSRLALKQEVWSYGWDSRSSQDWPNVFVCVKKNYLLTYGQKIKFFFWKSLVFYLYTKFVLLFFFQASGTWPGTLSHPNTPLMEAAGSQMSLTEWFSGHEIQVFRQHP